VQIATSVSTMTPFYIPYTKYDHIFLRLQPPHYLITANGGGLPIGGNIKVYAYNVDAVTPLCDLGKPSAGKYLYNFVLNSTLGEYRFMIPLKITQNGSLKTRKFPVNVGEEIVVKINGNFFATWRHGVDSTPYPFIEYKPGYICLRTSPGNTVTVTANNVGVTVSDVFVDDEINCWAKTCWRIAIGVTFGTTEYLFFTKVMQLVPCADSVSVFSESRYSYGATDCTGHFHSGNEADLGVRKHYLRTLADIEKRPSIIKKTYNSKCNQYKSERSEQFQYRSLPMPDWMQNAEETLLLGKDLLLDGVSYMIDNTENIFSIHDVSGSNFQPIDVPLSLCKCSTVFVC
jgi:hypothetical protein